MATEDNKLSSRIRVLEVVKTPLAFFVLVVLAVEALFAVVATGADGYTKNVIAVGMVIIALSMAGVVTYMAVQHPGKLGLARSLWEQELQQITKVVVTDVLCASTAQFEELGFSEDLSILETAFPARVTVQRDLRSARLRDRLTAKSFQIVHLLGYIHRDTGALCFDRQNTDQMPAAGLKALVETCRAQLVFLATCDSVFLAAQLAPITNIVAAHGSVEASKLIEWERCFYRLLADGRPLSHAYEVARATSEIPVILLLKHDVVFTTSQPPNQALQPTGAAATAGQDVMAPSRGPGG